MASPGVLAVVLAGGAGSRLELLTSHRAKPAIPVGGSHSLIDVALSNCAHSHIRNVWVIQQHHPAALADALRNGRPWDLDRNHGGLLVLPPRQGGDREGWHQGTADALWKNAPLIRELAPELLLVLSADALYRLDYAEVIDGHRASGAVATLVTTEVDAGPERFGVVQVDSQGTITGYAYKPDAAQGNLVSIEVFVFHTDAVLTALEDVATDDPDGLEDLGHVVLPRLVRAGGVGEHRFDGYWRDLGTVDSYFEAHMDLLPDSSRFELDAPDWPIWSSMVQPGATRIASGATLDNVLIGGGADIAGTVRHSVVGQGAVVEPGAIVSHSVVLPGALISRGANVHRTILDSGARVGPDSTIGRVEGGIALVGRDQRLPAGTDLEAGGRIPSQDSDRS
jgi:glucose-1-phosphate adenylyltransferase